MRSRTVRVAHRAAKMRALTITLTGVGFFGYVELVLK